MAQINARIDDDTFEAAQRYAASAGYGSMSELYRDLVKEGLYHRTEKPYASLVRQQVREELDAFASSIEARMLGIALDVLSSIDDSLSDRVEAVGRVSLAALIAASSAAAGIAGSADAEEVRLDSLEEAYALRDAWEVPGYGDGV